MDNLHRCGRPVERLRLGERLAMVGERLGAVCGHHARWMPSSRSRLRTRCVRTRRPSLAMPLACRHGSPHRAGARRRVRTPSRHGDAIRTDGRGGLAPASRHSAGWTAHARRSDRRVELRREGIRRRHPVAPSGTAAALRRSCRRCRVDRRGWEPSTARRSDGVALGHRRRSPPGLPGRGPNRFRRRRARNRRAEASRRCADDRGLRTAWGRGFGGGRFARTRARDRWARRGFALREVARTAARFGPRTGPRRASRRRAGRWRRCDTRDARGARPRRCGGRLSHDRELLPCRRTLAHPRDLGLQPRGAWMDRRSCGSRRVLGCQGACARLRRRCSRRARPDGTRGKCHARRADGRGRCIGPHARARLERRRGAGGRGDRHAGCIAIRSRWTGLSAEFRLRDRPSSSRGADPPPLASMDAERRPAARPSGVARARGRVSCARSRFRPRGVRRERSDRARALRIAAAVWDRADASLRASLHHDPRPRISEGDSRGGLAAAPRRPRVAAPSCRVASGRTGRARDPQRRRLDRGRRSPLVVERRHRAGEPRRLLRGAADRAGVGVACSRHPSARATAPERRAARSPSLRRDHVRDRRWHLDRDRVGSIARAVRRRLELDRERRVARTSAVDRGAGRIGRGRLHLARRSRSPERTRGCRKVRAHRPRPSPRLHA